MSEISDFNSQNITYATIQNRIQAAIIDSIILVVSMYFISEVFSLFGSTSDYLKIILSVIIFLVYDPFMTSFYGGTIGHTISKITVRKDGDPNKKISFPVAIFRFILKASLGWISLITITLDKKKKKAIHDGAANSVVINKHKE
ncbi:RDD family protein [Hyunsoonleella aquatilis]|uniref:RDD family protein n=1 Tax=Hyunsoonleella aquatilis TaxID=2762758 RepID=UPI003CCCFB1F